MLLRALRVQGFRCFAAPVALEGVAPGLVLVQAPNGTGKSTLFEALVRALFDAHTVSGREVEALRPWGRKLAPEVEVEFEQGGVGYKLRKRWLDAPRAELARREGAAFVPLAQGPAADEAVRALLLASAPTRGLSRAAHWGLAQALWMPQGEPRAEALSEGPLGAVRAAVGAELERGAGAAVRARVEARYAEFFAPQTGKLRSGKGAPEVVRVEAALAEAEQRSAAARALLAGFAAASERVDALRAGRLRAVEALERAERASVEARALAARAQELRAAVREGAARAGEARAVYDGLQAQQRALEQVQRARAAKEQQAREEQARSPALEAALRAAEGRAAAARERLAGLRAARRELDEKRATLDEAERFTRAKRALTRLAERAREEQAARERLRAAHAARAGVLAPDAETLRRLRAARAKLREGEARFAAQAVTLEWFSEGPEPVALRLLLGELVEGAEAEPGGALRVEHGARALARGAPEVLLALPGVGRVRARGGLGVEAAARARAERDEARATIAALCEPFSTDDDEALEARSREAEGLERAAREAEAALALARAAREREEAEGGGRGAATRAVERALSEFPRWADEAPEVSALRAEVEAARGGLERDEEAAEAEREAAEAERARAREARAGARQRAEGAERAASEAAEREAALRAELEGGAGERSSRARLAAAALEHDAASAQARDREAALRALGDEVRALARREGLEEEAGADVERLHAALERRERGLRAAAQAAVEDEKTEEGRLAHLAELGVYSAAAAADEEVARLRRDAQRERARAEAVRLLRAEVARAVGETVAAVAGPVAQRAQALLERVTGRALDAALEVDAGLAPVRLRARDEAQGEGAARGLEALSGGEREQVHLATRLALAEVLAAGERQLVVLDDALTYTDEARHARVLGLFEELARERLQLVVLTCHPARYASLVGTAVQRFDLRALREG